MKLSDLESDILLTQQQVAELLSLKWRTLNQRRLRGKLNIPWIQVGYRIRYRAEDVKRYLEDNKHV